MAKGMTWLKVCFALRCKRYTTLQLISAAFSWNKDVKIQGYNFFFKSVILGVFLVGIKCIKIKVYSFFF